MTAILQGDRHRYSRSAARLTGADVDAIRKRRAAGETYAAIHRDYQFVKLSTVVNLCYDRHRRQTR